MRETTNPIGDLRLSGEDLHGLEFGRLRVLTWVPTHARTRHWLCECVCGGRAIVAGYNLKNGNTRSCGCLRSEPWAMKHGSVGSRLYSVWRAMKKRCYQTASVNYHNYGGRGIVLCPEWRDDFSSFKAWALAFGYAEGLSIDRIDNDGIYEPVNCRWIERAAQTRNRRNTRKVVIGGEQMAMAEAAERFGIPYDRLKYRLRAGYAPEDAIRVGLDPLHRRIPGTANLKQFRT